MAFHDVRMPTDIERGATGGPMFKTTVWEADSGLEYRNARWSQTKGQWDVGYGLMQKFNESGGSPVVVDDLIQFFYPKYGRLHTFRFRDWADYDIGDQASPLSTAQEIGQGDDVTTDFPIYKRYSSGGFTFDRLIRLIVSGTYFVYIDSTLLTETTDYTINLLSGLISLTSPLASTGGSGPGGVELLKITSQFDNHVRLGTDHLQINMEVFNVGQWSSIPIDEVKEVPA